MLFPLTKEQYEALVPTWAKLLDTKTHTFSVGDRVYDVLYATLYGNDPFGMVLDAGPASELAEKGSQWIHVGSKRAPDGTFSRHASTVSTYYVPVPSDIEVEI